MKTKSCLFAVSLVLPLLLGVSVKASDDSLTTAVFASVKNGYKREKSPDGSFKREYYAISNGGRYSPGIAKDPSIDDVPFPAIAGALARHLAKQNYFLAQDAKSADLLLMISWGTTIPFNETVYRSGMDGVFTAMNAVDNIRDQMGGGRGTLERLNIKAGGGRSADGIQSDGASAAQAAQEEFVSSLFTMEMFNDMRRKANEYNARLLGYSGEINDKSDNSRFAGGGTYYDDLNSDIEEGRYYLIISAYDFRAAVKDKQQKLLWVTRVSIRAHGNRFDERLNAMLANASRQFGRSSGRLIRQYQVSPRVDLGELKFLGTVPDAQVKLWPPERNGTMLRNGGEKKAATWVAA